MRSVAFAQGEGRANVSRKVGGLFDDPCNCCVDLLLVGFADLGDGLLLRLLSPLKEFLLLGLLGLLVLDKVLLVKLAQVDAGNVNDSRGCNNVAGVYAAEGNTIELEGASNEDDTAREGLQVDDALPTESAGEDDEDCAGLEGGAESGRLLSFANLLVDWFVFGGIPLARLLGGNLPLPGTERDLLVLCRHG